MGPVLSMSRLRAVLAVAVDRGVSVAVTACSPRAGGGNPNLVAGKQLFVKNCGSCHVARRAPARRATSGPNLDQAFQQSLKDGFGRNGIDGRRARIGSCTRNPRGPDAGQDRQGRRRRRRRRLRRAVGRQGAARTPACSPRRSRRPAAGSPRSPRTATLEIDADPTGQLAYVTKAAAAPAGKLTVKMRNKSGTPHNIAIDGKGAGKEVTKRRRLVVQRRPSAAGSYTFYCTVPGHRAAGMEGTLTVK